MIFTRLAGTLQPAVYGASAPTLNCTFNKRMTRKKPRCWRKEFTCACHNGCNAGSNRCQARGSSKCPRTSSQRCGQHHAICVSYSPNCRIHVPLLAKLCAFPLVGIFLAIHCAQKMLLERNVPIKCGTVKHFLQLGLLYFDTLFVPLILCWNHNSARHPIDRDTVCVFGKFLRRRCLLGVPTQKLVEAINHRISHFYLRSRHANVAQSIYRWDWSPHHVFQ